MQIVPLEREEDIEACRAIYNHYVEDTLVTLECAPLSRFAFAARVFRIKERYPYLVAKAGDEAVGYAYLHEYGEREGYSQAADLSVYVEEHHLHQGIGKALVEAILPLGKRMGLTNVVSVVTSVNRASIAFHEALGFVNEGEVHGIAHKHGERFGVVYLNKEL